MDSEFQFCKVKTFQKSFAQYMNRVNTTGLYLKNS